MRLPRTPDGIATEATHRSHWNGKSLRKNTFWILSELRSISKNPKRRIGESRNFLDKQKDLF